MFVAVSIFVYFWARVRTGSLAATGGGEDESVDYESSYLAQPGAMMPKAASFREALWSSSVPSEMSGDFRDFATGRGKKVALETLDALSSVVDENKSAVGGEQGGLSI